MAGEQLTTLGAAGGGDLQAAAEVIAGTARELAGWSAKVPGSITVTVSGQTATIKADAPAAYPAETRARHPLFGSRDHWYGPPGSPFLGPALDRRAGDALARYAKKIDSMCRKAGFS